MKLRLLLSVLSLSMFAVPLSADDAVPAEDEVVRALQHLEEVQKWHLKTLTDLLDSVPDPAKPAIEHAIGSSQKGLEHSRAAIAKARGGDEKPGKGHGKPDGVGHGKPDGVGHKPAGVGGKSDGAGHKPDGVGRPDGVGKPAGAGKGVGKGGPAGGGKPNKG